MGWGGRVGGAGRGRVLSCCPTLCGQPAAVAHNPATHSQFSQFLVPSIDPPCSYTKFLVDRNGVARKRYKPSFDPADFEGGGSLWAPFFSNPNMLCASLGGACHSPPQHLVAASCRPGARQPQRAGERHGCCVTNGFILVQLAAQYRAAPH